jgi:SAM-dependent methyltransferase
MSPILTSPDETCPVCKERCFRVLFHVSDRLYRTTDRQFCVVECGSCNVIRLNPQPSPSELSLYYPTLYWFSKGGGLADLLANAYRRLVLSDHLQFVRRSLRESGEAGAIVDVGCGGGLFLSMLQKEHRHVMGLDISKKACSVAWGIFGVPAACGSLGDAPLRPDSCAAITLFHVLEHVYDPKQDIEAAHRLLRRNGRLIIQVPNAASWQFRLFGKRWNGLDVPRHLITFRATDVDRLLDCCGFEILRHKYFSLRDNPTGVVTSLFPSLDPMGRRVRRLGESRGRKFLKDCAYLALVVMALPFAVGEALCGAGTTVMVEARKKW